VASQADVVLVSLPTPNIVTAVASGVASGTRAKVFVDLSTTGPRVAAEVAAQLKEKGIVAIDAPVSGGPAGAEKGTLAVMASGPKDHVEALRPVLSVIGKVFWVGEQAGMGQMVKLCNNLLSAAALTITAEAMVLGAKAGLDPTAMLEVINAGSGRNTATADKFPRCVVPRTFDFGFANELLYKDVRLCLEEGERLGVPMVVGNAVRQLLAIVNATEGISSDITRVVRPLETWAGVEVKSGGAKAG
jgi:3-hydroxyisobutyrate dehydrogenase-like beta-hydroxyacid dehydrogenase